IFCRTTRNASALLSPDFHLTQNGNRHFSLCFQGCDVFHASKIGEPPIPAHICWRGQAAYGTIASVERAETAKEE
ncbi:MAG: hypothetical protein II649_10935, partial [Kiritimatiellae bacterium]|nr:hypothetical protein [Kiritimatiellia bacterium]